MRLEKLMQLFKKKEKLRFGNEQNVHASLEKYEENGYGHLALINWHSNIFGATTCLKMKRDVYF